MKIGHSKLSQTFIPDVVYDYELNLAYIDCPGFNDNRGSEINIANAVNIRQCFQEVKSIRIIIIINYNTFKTDRGQGVRELVEMTKQLFGSEEKLLENRDSIMICISKSPTGGDEPFDILDAQEEIRECFKDELKCFADKVFT